MASGALYNPPRDVTPEDRNSLMPLLRQLTSAPDVSEEAFAARVAMLNREGDGDAMPRQFCVVVPRTSDNCIVATASVTFEYKLLRSCAVCAHVEDVVVDASARGAGLGKMVVDACVQRARAVEGCYKVILDCAEKNVAFYEKLGFQRKEVQMAMYL